MDFVIGNALYVEHPTDELRSWCRENLEIANPEYQQRARMGLWLGKTPQKVLLYEKIWNGLRIPYGCLRELRKFVLAADNVVMAFPEQLDVEFGGKVPLYDYQEEAVSAMFGNYYGILQSPTGSGKTQMGLALAEKWGCRTLWLTHTKDLLNQSMERAAQYFDKTKFGTITEGEVNIGTTITFATIQTMCRTDLWKYRDVWDTVIVDECHRVAGTPTMITQFSRVLNELRARHKYGLSATVHRSDGMIRATTALLGEVAYKVPDEAVEDKIMRVAIQAVGTGVGLTSACLNPDGTIAYSRLINYLAEDEGRNLLIRTYLWRNRNRYCLILSDRVGHLKELIDGMSENERKNAVMITGKTKKEDREAALEQMRNGEKHFLFATYQLAKEGLDIPRLDRLFLVTPHKDYAVVVQSVGRIARRFPEKIDAYVFDFVDNCEYLLRSFKQRCRHYRKLNAVIFD